jgi:hypothetical protein
MRKFPRILFFVESSMPTAKDFLEADQLGPNVSFRNARMTPSEGAFEKCDGVAGCVPERILKAVDKEGKRLFPAAKDAIAKYKKETEESFKLAEKAAKEQEQSGKKTPEWKPNA